MKALKVPGQTFFKHSFIQKHFKEFVLLSQKDTLHVNTIISKIMFSFFYYTFFYHVFIWCIGGPETYLVGLRCKSKGIH